MATMPVEYRIYGFSAGTTGGLPWIDNVALTFNAAVPEPSSRMATVLVSAPALAVCVRRLRSGPSPIV